MLNKRDRTRLAAIESRLITDDPALAERFQALDQESWPVWFVREHRMLTVAAIALLGALAVFCMATGLYFSALLLVVISAGAGWLLHTHPMPSANDEDTPE